MLLIHRSFESPDPRDKDTASFLFRASRLSRGRYKSSSARIPARFEDRCKSPSYGVTHITHLHPVLPVVPLQRCGEENTVSLDVIKAAKTFLVAGQHDTIFARLLNANAVVRERVGRVEVEDKHQTCPLEDDNLVYFVLERDVCRRGGEPAVLALQVIHSLVEIVEVSVAEERVVYNIPLPACIVE